MNEVITIECPICKFLNVVLCDEKLWLYYYSANDWGVNFKCWYCKKSFVKMIHYKGLIPIPN
jgi:hypothetical protein